MHKRTLQFMYVVLGATVLLLISIGVFAFRSLNDLINEGDLVAHTSNVLFQSEQVISVIREVESSQRGFIITRDSSFLNLMIDPYSVVAPQLNKMDSLLNISPVPIQRLRLSRLKDFAKIRIASLKQTLAISSETQSPDQQLRLMTRLHRGKSLMDSVRMVLDSLEDTEKVLLEARIQQKKLTANHTIGLLTLISLLAIGLFTLSFYLVIQEIIRRQRYEQQLESTVVDLRRTNQDLEQFAYVTPHHLQEPLRKLQTFSNRLIQKYGGELNADAMFLTGRLSDLAGHMQTLLEDLLTYTTVGKNVERADFTSIDLAQVLQKVVVSHKEEIAKSKAVIKWEKKTWEMPGNFAQLELLFSQLLQNSLKFVDENQNPNITVRISATQGKEMAFAGSISAEKRFLKIVFSDNGIGIESKYRDKVFELFQRLHHAKDYPGTGIGLAICKQIVHQHKGYIELAETKQGTSFNLYFPI